MRRVTVALAALGLSLGSMVPAEASGSIDPFQGAPAGLEVVAYDGFDYATGSLTDLNGGLGWTSAWAGSWPFQVQGTSLSYADLTSRGGSIRFFNFFGNSYSAGSRYLPRQDSGVVYIQFLSNITLNNGGGAPEVRLLDGDITTAAIGNNGGSTIDILDGTLDVHKAESSTAITGLHMNIVQIDYDAQTTKLWVDPVLSTFDYLNPPAASATANSFAPVFNRLNPITKGGTYDEIAVMRVVAVGAPTDLVVGSGNKMVHVRWKAPTSSSVTGYKVQYRVSGDGEWSNGVRGCSLAETSDLDQNCNMSGLQNDVSYDFRVAAFNASGMSEWIVASGMPTHPGEGKPAVSTVSTPSASTKPALPAPAEVARSVVRSLPPQAAAVARTAKKK